MKTINIKQLGQTLLGAASMALVLFSCTEGFAPDPEPEPTPGGGAGEPLEMVSVPLNLSTETLSEASGQVSKAPRTTQWTEGAMDVELTEGPIEEPQGKALAGESTIANVWILQFDGTDASSKLLYKMYLPAYAAGDKVELVKATAYNRVVVLCNTFDAAFADAFIAKTTTYAQVAASANMTRAVTASSGVLVSNGGTEYIPMYGVYDGLIALGDATPAAIEVVRTVAKVVLKVKSGADLNATALAVSVCDVPNVMNWIPATGTEVYPASPTTVDFDAVGISGVNTTTYQEATFWVPVNRRGVAAGTTTLTRVTNAPSKSTYLNMTTESLTSLGQLFEVTYKLHLGANFLTDYNVQYNTQYTYTVTLQRDILVVDSRVLEVELPLVGRFGGTLIPDAGGVWQFSSLLVADISDASASAQWAATNVTTNVTDKWAGKGNTWLLNKSAALASSTGYPAANSCFNQNAGWAALTSADDAKYVWYLPAEVQLQALWVAHSSFAAAHKLGSASYWSATESTATYAWYVDLGNGVTYNVTHDKTGTYRTRCVREVSE